MTEIRRSSPPTAASGEDRPSASLLVRCWYETPGGSGATPVLRGYVKNLKTGEEAFFQDVDAVGGQILRQLDFAAAPAASATAREAES